MTEHTPGPWTVSGPNQIGDVGVSARGHGPVATMASLSGRVPLEVLLANARLIAAAPALLAAVKATVPADGYGFARLRHAIQMAEANEHD